jgi:hypothetical protein
VTSQPWSPRRCATLAVILLVAAGSAALAALVSIWFAAPLPLLAAGAYAVLLGMTPDRFMDALDDDGTGVHPPL